VFDMVYAADIGQQFADLIGNVVGVGIRVVIFLVIIGLGWFVANWLRKWIAKGLQRIGFDRAAERGGLQRMLGRYAASDLTARLVMYAFLLFVLQLAFGIFGPNPVSALIEDVIRWLPKLFAAVIIIVVTAAIAGWLKNLIRDGLAGVSYGGAVATGVQVFVLALGVIAAVQQIGVATSVTLPVLISVLATAAGVIIVGVGGGLIKPMQHRWERMLNRAETETTLAAEKVRAHRAQIIRDRNVNVTGGFEQRAYGGGQPSDAKPSDTKPSDAKPSDTKPSAEPRPGAGSRSPTGQGDSDEPTAPQDPT
jgi:Conserved TM helix